MKKQRVIRRAVLGGVLVLGIMCIYNVYTMLYNEEMVEQDTIKIGLSSYKASDTFIASIVSEFEKLVKEEQLEHTHLTLDIAHAQENQVLQNEQIERYINLEYDVICINIVDRTSAASVIDKADEAGIPIIFFNRQPVEEDLYRSDNVYYIGSNPKESAVLQGQLIQAMYEKQPSLLDTNQNGKLEYAILEGEVGHQDTIIRTEYAIETLKDSGIELEKVVGWRADFEKSQAQAAVERWFREEVEDRHIEIILSNNDDMALGAAEALHKQDRTDIAIVGIDGTPEGKKAVEEGVLLGTIVSDQKVYAHHLFALCKALLWEKESNEQLVFDEEKYIWIPWYPFTKD